MHNGLGLGEVGDLEVQMFNKPQMLIEVQMLNLALLPPFCQTLVMHSAFGALKYFVKNSVKLFIVVFVQVVVWNTQFFKC